MLKESIERIRGIAQTLPDDDPDKLEMLNTEGNYTALMEWAIRKRLESVELAAACKAMSETYRTRAEAFTNRAEKMKDIIGWIMQEAKETKYQGVSATVSFGKKKQGVVVLDENKIPESFFKIERKLDKVKLNEAVLKGQTVHGACLDNGGQTLTIRSK
jgi:hypothetical protein